MAETLRLDPADDVVVALVDLPPRRPIDTRVTTTTAIAAGHKIATRDIATGELVRKYGQVIGMASADISVGDHVHTHNLTMANRDARATVPTAAGVGTVTSAAPATAARTFAGIRRPNGRVGTRNYLGVLTTVNCSATVAQRVARHFDTAELPDGIDGVVALTHASGCGLDDAGPGWDILQRTLRGYASHPNIGGVVVIGLGCEVLSIADLMVQLGAVDVPYTGFTIQEAGGTKAAIARGIAEVENLAASAHVSRTDCGLGDLVLGLKCGGSDAWSGLSANPVLGYASDQIVSAGGTAILAETPEVYGAEHLLAARAPDEAVAAELMRRIQWWEDYTASHGATMDANPSAGNKTGGITTIAEKSLGAVAKAGSAPLTAVVDYGAEVPHGGLVMMDTPGYDPVSVTGIVAGGATVVCFTTGRGSVFGSKPTPTLKLATNSALAQRMSDDIDLDCGPIIDGSSTVAALGETLLDLICATASGVPTRSEEQGLGNEEIVVWQMGAVL